MKSEGPKLVPFFKATCVYFVLWLPTSSPSWFSALIKCLPIFCLWVFLLAHGISFLGAHSSARKILAGLIFSSLGDAFLIWQEQGYFSHGEFYVPYFVSCHKVRLDTNSLSMVNVLPQVSFIFSLIKVFFGCTLTCVALCILLKYNCT